MYKKMWLKCPQCGKRFKRGEIHHLSSFPFCSRRCKLNDLWGWLENKYKITTSLNMERNENDD